MVASEIRMFDFQIEADLKARKLRGLVREAVTFSIRSIISRLSRYAKDGSFGTING